MRYHIDTIPVWDAYKHGGECPLCEIARHNEQEYLDVFMGASVMEPSRRVEVNERGFCARHLRLMFGNGNRLGLALMAHTHLKETMGKIDEINKAALACAGEDAKKAAPARLLGRATKTSAPLKGIEAQAERAAQTAQTCLFCEKLSDTMDRYVHTLIYMWKHETEFRRAFAESKGLCLEHYAQVMVAAPEQLSGRELEEFIRALTEVQKKNLERIEKELEWFTLKFDYRNADKPWGNSQDAVERTLRKLRGYSAVDEEKKEDG
jgi:hypothetical protein